MGRLKATKDAPIYRAPLIDKDPNHPRIATFVGNGDYCGRCEEHGDNHYRVRYHRAGIWTTHHYLCPDKTRVTPRGLSLELL